jgi:hypothetical protein
MTAQHESVPINSPHLPYGHEDATKELLETSIATPTESGGKAAMEEGGEPQTADQVLGALGSRNPYLLFVWVAMSIVWCLTAMLMMISSFTMGEKQLCPEVVSSAGEVR